MGRLYGLQLTTAGQHVASAGYPQSRWMAAQEVTVMCRNIRTLFNFDPPATEEEVRAAALQFVRKISGFNKPSQANQEAFDAAVEAVFEGAWTLLDSLETSAGPRNREVEAAKARARAAKRFGTETAQAAT